MPNIFTKSSILEVCCQSLSSVLAKPAQTKIAATNDNKIPGETAEERSLFIISARSKIRVKQQKQSCDFPAEKNFKMFRAKNQNK